jgi:hypothetical protein
MSLLCVHELKYLYPAMYRTNTVVDFSSFSESNGSNQNRKFLCMKLSTVTVAVIDCVVDFFSCAVAS